jgi:hypothetical protein
LKTQINLSDLLIIRSVYILKISTPTFEQRQGGANAQSLQLEYLHLTALFQRSPTRRMADGWAALADVCLFFPQTVRRFGDHAMVEVLKQSRYYL